jgi:hypothetical protein
MSWCSRSRRRANWQAKTTEAGLGQSYGSIVGRPELIQFTIIRHRGGWSLRSSRSLLAATLALLSGGVQLAVAFCVDFVLTPASTSFGVM